MNDIEKMEAKEQWVGRNYSSVNELILDFEKFKNENKWRMEKIDPNIASLRPVIRFYGKEFRRVEGQKGKPYWELVDGGEDVFVDAIIFKLEKLRLNLNFYDYPEDKKPELIYCLLLKDDDISKYRLGPALKEIKTIKIKIEG